MPWVNVMINVFGDFRQFSLSILGVLGQKLGSFFIKWLVTLLERRHFLAAGRDR
jgi:hypothetical protein